jgi:hypothetical protein
MEARRAISGRHLLYKLVKGATVNWSVRAMNSNKRQ